MREVIKEEDLRGLVIEGLELRRQEVEAQWKAAMKRSGAIEITIEKLIKERKRYASELEVLEENEKAYVKAIELLKKHRGE